MKQESRTPEHEADCSGLGVIHGDTKAGKGSRPGAEGRTLIQLAQQVGEDDKGESFRPLAKKIEKMADTSKEKV